MFYLINIFSVTYNRGGSRIWFCQICEKLHEIDKISGRKGERPPQIRHCTKYHWITSVVALFIAHSSSNLIYRPSMPPGTWVLTRCRNLPCRHSGPSAAHPPADDWMWQEGKSRMTCRHCFSHFSQEDEEQPEGGTTPDFRFTFDWDADRNCLCLVFTLLPSAK